MDKFTIAQDVAILQSAIAQVENSFGRADGIKTPEVKYICARLRDLAANMVNLVEIHDLNAK